MILKQNAERVLKKWESYEFKFDSIPKFIELHKISQEIDTDMEEIRVKILEDRHRDIVKSEIDKL